MTNTICSRTHPRRSVRIIQRLLRLDGRYLSLLGSWIVVQIAFSSTAFRIDEPNILAIARQVYQSPLDPYGFKINWLGVSASAFKVLANPPLVPSLLAALKLLFPWTEVSLHLAILPFSLLALQAFRMLAKAFDVDAFASVLLLCCSPAFFLGSQVVMPDVVMLSLMLASISFAIAYDRQAGSIRFWIAFTAGFCAPLAKYNGVILIFLLGLLLLRSRRKTSMLLIASAPLLSLAIWSILSWIRYGIPHFIAIAEWQKNNSIPYPISLVGVFCAVGLGVTPLGIGVFVPKFHHDHRSVWLIIATLFLVAVPLARGLGYGPTSATLFAFSIALFCHVLILTLACAWKTLRNGDSQAALPAVWILIGLVLQSGLMFSSVRYVLFLAPPIILLFLTQSAWRPPAKLIACIVGLNFSLVLAIAVGDAKIHNAYRQVVLEQIQPLIKKEGGKFYFSGHWGFQHYAEAVGGRHLEPPDTIRPGFKQGDLIAVATTAWPSTLVLPVAEGQIVHTTTLPFQPQWPVRTIDCTAAANFYSPLIIHCPRPTWLPWAFSDGPSEIFSFYTITSKPSRPTHGSPSSSSAAIISWRKAEVPAPRILRTTGESGCSIRSIR